MIDRSFIEKIEEMAAPTVIDVPEGTFSKEPLYRINAPLAECIKMGSLGGLVEMISRDNIRQDRPLFVRVTDATSVDVFGPIRSDMLREQPYRAEAHLPNIAFNSYMDIEKMIITLKSKFEPTDDREYLIQLLGNISDNKSVQTKDDGITQSVTVTAGIAMVGEQRIKPIVKLKPYRTFLEVSQPESEFLIRVKDGCAALFEADGGRWELEAMRNIGDYLREAFKGADDVIVVE